MVVVGWLVDGGFVFVEFSFSLDGWASLTVGFPISCLVVVEFILFELFCLILFYLF